jgi:hypothetical protein
MAKIAISPRKPTSELAAAHTWAAAPAPISARFWIACLAVGLGAFVLVYVLERLQ